MLNNKLPNFVLNFRFYTEKYDFKLIFSYIIYMKLNDDYTFINLHVTAGGLEMKISMILKYNLFSFLEYYENSKVNKS